MGGSNPVGELTLARRHTSAPRGARGFEALWGSGISEAVRSPTVCGGLKVSFQREKVAELWILPANLAVPGAEHLSTGLTRLLGAPGVGGEG